MKKNTLIFYRYYCSMKKLFSIFLAAAFFLLGREINAQSNSKLPAALAYNIQNNNFVYNGYRFDISQVLNDEHLKEILYQLEWEVYFINALYLPQEIQNFFKSIVVVIAPQKGDPNDKFITLTSDELYAAQLSWNSCKEENLCLLFYFLEALLDEYLPQGINNPNVVKYFNEAKSLPCYQKTNPTWISDSSSTAIYYFFTISAISYLRGSFWEAPFSCYEIQKNQPEFFHYLENLFGPKGGFLSRCFSYHGFNFNCSQIYDFSQYQEVSKECIRQVAYIELIGLPKNTIDFFKSVPITLQPWYQMPNYASGAYYGDSKSIVLCYNDFCDNQKSGEKSPVFLHELLHVFHHQQIANGWDNPDIIKYFKEAQERHYYQLPHTKNPTFINYLMTNEYEFFACTATAFLVDFELFQPFNRDNVFQHQPEYYHYLQNLFGINPHNMYVDKISSPSIDSLY